MIMYVIQLITYTNYAEDGCLNLFCIVCLEQIVFNESDYIQQVIKAKFLDLLDLCIRTTKTNLLIRNEMQFFLIKMFMKRYHLVRSLITDKITSHPTKIHVA